MKYTVNMTPEHTPAHATVIVTDKPITMDTCFYGYPLSTWMGIRKFIPFEVSIWVTKDSDDNYVDEFNTDGRGDAYVETLAQWLINIHCKQLPDLVDRLTAQVRAKLLSSEEDITIEQDSESTAFTFILTTSYYGSINTTCRIQVTDPLTGEFKVI